MRWGGHPWMPCGIAVYKRNWPVALYQKALAAIVSVLTVRCLLQTWFTGAIEVCDRDDAWFVDVNQQIQTNFLCL